LRRPTFAGASRSLRDLLAASLNRLPRLANERRVADGGDAPQTARTLTGELGTSQQCIFP
jgi:hypothetical protein